MGTWPYFARHIFLAQDLLLNWSEIKAEGFYKPCSGRAKLDNALMAVTGMKVGLGLRHK